MSVQSRETGSHYTNAFIDNGSAHGSALDAWVPPQDGAHAPPPAKRRRPSPEALAARVEYLEVALEGETQLRRLMQEEALHANITCAAYHELSVNFCATFIASEGDFRRTIKELRDHVAAWEAWGARARAVLERNGLLKATAEEALEAAGDSCSVATADECSSQCDSKRMKTAHPPGRDP